MVRIITEMVEAPEGYATQTRYYFFGIPVWQVRHIRKGGRFG